MIWWVIAVEALVFAAIFTAAVLGIYLGDKKYSTAGIANYPPDIQEEYFRTHEKIDVPASKAVRFKAAANVKREVNGK